MVNPDHISYFNISGVNALALAAGWTPYKIRTTFPIDLFLFNPESNYIKDRTKGKSAHFARIEFNNLIHSISIDSTNRLYEIMAELGIGRDIIAIYQKT